ncbi:Hypothetical predicted protein [Cloeon dipterum]|uniref:Uncharacterized protein n=1 Tax=Cloeon dipterum TaxID=197152 RepID=A0A8S1DJX9_9INSE|nr:Hypothetical predicted protein [Cloeon dipterum]
MTFFCDRCAGGAIELLLRCNLLKHCGSSLDFFYPKSTPHFCQTSLISIRTRLAFELDDRQLESGTVRGHARDIINRKGHPLGGTKFSILKLAALLRHLRGWGVKKRKLQDASSSDSLPQKQLLSLKNDTSFVLNWTRIYNEAMARLQNEDNLVKYECSILDQAQKMKIEQQYLDYLLNQVKTLRDFPPSYRPTVLLELKTIRCQNPYGDEIVLQKVVLPTCAMMANEIFGPHLDSVNLTGLISFCHPDQKFHIFQEVLKTIFKVAYETIGKVLLMRHLDMDPLMHHKIYFCDLLQLKMMYKMKHLNELRIELFSCKLDEILDVIYCCRFSLVFVSVNIDLDDSGLPPHDWELQEKLANLRIFLFRSPSKVGVEQLNQLCVTYLPKLQVVQEFASEFCTGEDLPRPDPEETNQDTHVSNLLHLTINLDTFLRGADEIHLRFPYVTHLKVFQKDGLFSEEVDLRTVEFLLNFSNVEHLDIRLSRPSTFNLILEKLLEAYDRKIKTLCVVSLSPRIQTCGISHIFQQCPNLEKLNFVSHQMEVDRLQPRINHLTELELLVTHISKNRSDLLSFILRSVCLERVKLIGQTENPKDVENVICSIQGTKAILRNLRSLVIDMDCVSIRQVKEDTFKSFL